jgi:type II secretory pathway component PulK
MKKTLRMLSDDSGAALMMAIFTVTMLMIIATEIMYETNVEYAVSTQSVNQVKAHYAAKAGVEISLLRLHIWRKITDLVKPEMLNMMPMLDMIWNVPFTWPPMIPDATNSVDKSDIKDSVKKSLMQSQYVANLESESSKIDLSLLAVTPVIDPTQPHKAGDPDDIVTATTKQIAQVFLSKMETDENFAKRYRPEDVTALASNIRDWVDADDKADRGDEKAAYANLNMGDKIPPNRPFKTFEELHMVAGMTDELYNLLIPRVTIYGARAINVRYATKETLMAALALTDEVAGKVIEERSKQDTTSFKDPKSFLDFVETLGVRHEALYDSTTGKAKINILVEPEFNFRVKSVGVAGKVQREITAIVYDYDLVLHQVRSQAAAANQPNTGAQKPVDPANPVDPTKPQQPAQQQAPQIQRPPAKNERPNIVYWNET